MKTSPMVGTTLLISVILAVWFLPFGYSLKCYSYDCSKTSAGPIPSCAPPQELTCSPFPGVPMAPDRCITQRFLLEQSMPGVGVVTIQREIRNCSYSFQCQNMRDLTCNAANATGMLKKCEVGCCQGDLCNSGGPIPTQAPRPTGPSGADLSCLACSNAPNFGVQRDCSNPITQTCGAGLSPFLPQDRCMTAKGLAKIPGLPHAVEFQIKNCSNAAMCNPIAFCGSANASLSGGLEICQVSCCFGNLCNGDGAITKTAATATATSTETRTSVGGTSAPTVLSTATGHTLTGLTCFSALIAYFCLIHSDGINLSYLTS